MHVLPGLERVDTPAALLSKEEGLHGRSQDGTTRSSLLVVLAVQPHNDRAQAKHKGWEGVREPETNVLLSEDHGNLTN